MVKKNNDWYKKFAEAFHEVVVPVLEDLEKKLEEKLASKEDIDRLEMKLTKMEDRLDRHGKTLDNHERKIEKLDVKFLSQNS